MKASLTTTVLALGAIALMSSATFADSNTKAVNHANGKQVASQAKSNTQKTQNWDMASIHSDFKVR